jgi:hypothetical protein
MDLSKIEFEALRKRFKEAKHKNTDLEVSKAAIRAQLEKLIRLNRMRMDFQEQFLHQASCASPPAKIGCYLRLQNRSVPRASIVWLPHAVNVVRPAVPRLHIGRARFAKGGRLGNTLGMCMSVCLKLLP